MLARLRPPPARLKQGFPKGVLRPPVQLRSAARTVVEGLLSVCTARGSVRFVRLRR
jgi:hypothetical protein